MRHLVLALSGAMALCASAAQADESADAESAFQRGVELANARRFDEAAASFRRSFELDPTRGALQALALAEERGGRPGPATMEYRRLADLALSDGDLERAEAATQGLARLEPMIGRVVLSIPEGRRCRIEVEERSYPCMAPEQTLAVTPGQRTLRVADSSTTLLEVRLLLAAGTTQRLDVPPARAQAEQPHLGERIARRPVQPEQVESADLLLAAMGGSTLAVGVVAVGVGTWLWLDADATYDRIRDACALEPADCRRRFRDDAADGELKETAGVVLWVTGGATAAAGAALTFWGLNRGPVSAKVGPASASVRWHF